MQIKKTERGEVRSTITKYYYDPRLFKRLVDFFKKVDGTELIPRIINIDEEAQAITFDLCIPLKDELPKLNKRTRLGIARKIFNKARKINDMHYQHGDIHLYNIVLTEDYEPLLIDWEHLTQTDHPFEKSVDYKVFNQWSHPSLLVALDLTIEELQEHIQKNRLEK